MSEREHIISSQAIVTCDAGACPRREASEVVRSGSAPFMSHVREFHRALKRQGWTRWVGRGVRWYCPNHGPSAGSKMRKDES